MKLHPTLRTIILIELLVPLLLLSFGIYHGLLQVLYRAGFIQSMGFLGIDYYQGLTAHGVINALVLTTFFGVAFGHAVITQFLALPISISAALSSLSLMLLGVALTAGAIFTGKASVLYTFYPPLKAHPAFYFGLVFFVIGSWIAFYSWIPLYLKWRRLNPEQKTPLAVVGILSTFIVWQIATLPVAFEIIALLIPWSLNWTPGVNVVLARTLFWFFGHPLVYFWLLPTYTMYYVVLPKIAGGKLFSDFAGRFALMMFCVFSAPLGLHHQFADPGISSRFKAFHAILTSIVAIPSMMTAFSLAASLEYSAARRGGSGLFAWWKKLPFFEPNNWLFPYLFGGLLIFIFGGITGVINASYNMNAIVHNTSWLPAHFHMTVGGPVFLAILGMSLHLIGSLMNKEIAWKKLALWAPYCWVLGIFIFSSGLFIGGIHGEPRRTHLGLTYLNRNSPFFRPDWVHSTHITALGGILMTLAAVLYFSVVIKTLCSSQRKAETILIPTAEPLHDENIGFVKNFKPWLIAAIIFNCIAYIPPLQQIMNTEGDVAAPGFHPDSPAPNVSNE